ncbi:flagellar l-ring protein [Lucifera butyrica]|uniref:Flagellar l-ring protein n=1 Tax=Lucifera butyrica TaxID=1351585 RepID=A0A498RDC5_9FIRM|nr:flagellar basal body L-ring protein FlgH [Lucifera butyrica]VBB08917.1 flagellar l-ring protein [Lucifera butyrica]
MNALKRNVILLTLAIGLVVLAPVHRSEADSLWSDNGPGAAMFSDRKAHSIGDSLTIIINENSSASRVGQANNTKSSSTNLTAGTGLLSGWIPGASAGSSDSFKTSGTLTNTNTLSGRMTAQVIAVKPNGNLVIQGTQSVKQNGEEQKFIVSGVVRPEDISPDNTVYSYSIADAHIDLEGKGPISAKERQGILTQLFNFLF